VVATHLLQCAGRDRRDSWTHGCGHCWSQGGCAVCLTLKAEAVYTGAAGMEKGGEAPPGEAAQ
jgi:hypothetical protein